MAYEKRRPVRLGGLQPNVAQLLTPSSEAVTFDACCLKPGMP